ncbi:hypothetical protein DERF_010540 [Dermatophagoides farinae]|uniref:3-dehydrosphinganine reductase n=1 Tax=Dermatophagoides farinae TaxID=6954 RepID=A0A922I0C6_DERFA|nr:3-ketodihydrosphingosine reductase-like [Dermatophagoides farinae]KAH7643138.1 hypothetical protein HUG17_9829 [Dermatophagoides farinae]KAH9512142.1 hypothetical protein DERF_010540 [Dermatophagoides farinae]
MIYTLLTIFIIILAIIYLYEWFKSLCHLKQLNGRHVFITGGTKGIGLEIAKICVKNGANVTIVARDEECLQQTKIDLISMANNCDQQNILTFSVDISNRQPFQLERAIFDAESDSGPIDLLICCAGTAIARTFNECSLDEFHRMMNVNYFGTVNTIKTCLQSLKKSQMNPARIMIFSSIAGLFGLYGYSAYSAAKFALVGLAESLDMELRPHNIRITVSFPPDTDTPGFANEQHGKPKITELISDEGGLFTPEQVAKKSLNDFLNNQFISTVGLNGFVVTTLCSGMMPCYSWSQRLLQISTMGPLRAIGLYFLYSCEQIVQKNFVEKIRQTVSSPSSSSTKSKKSE